MFRFGKKEKSKPESSDKPKEAMPPSGTAIYVMPDKFQIPEAKSFWTAGKIWGVVAAVMVLLVGGVYFLLAGVTRQVEPPSVPASVAEEAVNPTEQVPALLPSEPTPEPKPIIKEEIPPVEETPKTPKPLKVLPSSQDTDNDGLTDKEEALYGTNPNLADTDGDGYNDLSELKNGYSPLGPEKLTATELFSSYEDASGSYTFSYPAAWSTHLVGGDGVRLTASSDEFVLVLTQPNPDRLSARQWYLKTVPSATPASVRAEIIGDKVGVYTPDRRSYYFILADNPEVIYIVSHNAAAKTEVDFYATVKLIIRSFSFPKTEINTNNNSSVDEPTS